MNEVLDPTLAHATVVKKHAEKAQASVLPRVASLLNRIIFLSLLITIALAAIPYGTVEPWWISVFNTLIFLLATLAVIETLITKDWRIGGLPLGAPLLALTLFIALQSVPLFSRNGLRVSLSADPYGSRLFAIRLFALIVAGALLVRYTNSRTRLRALVYSLIALAVGCALFGILRKNVQQSPGFFLPYLNPDERGFAQFINKNHFAFLMEMSLGLTLGLMLGEAGRHRRTLLLLPVTAILWVALIYSNSRGGIVASLCQLLFIGFFLDPVRRLTKERARTTWHRFQNLAGGLAVRIFLVVCLVALFAYGVGWVGGEPVVNNFQLAAEDFTQQATYANSNTSRKEMWSTTWRLIKDHPLAGVGFAGYWIGITKYHNASGEVTPQQAHNDYLELLASGGVIGAGLVLWFVVAFLRKSREGLRAPDPYCRAACLGALTGIFGVAFHSFVDFGLHITINALVFTTLIVIASVNIADAPSDL
jgi:O-antigen ligase